MKIRRLDLSQKRAFTLGDKVSEQPVALIKNTDLITNKKGNERQIHPGRGYDFNGTTEYVDFGDHDDFSFGDSLTDSPFSCSLWAYTETTSGFRPFIAKLNTPTDHEWDFYIDDSSDALTVLLKDNSVSKFLIARSQTAFQEDVWQHLAFTYDGTSTYGGISVYVNGVEIATNDLSTAGYIAMEARGNPLTIGMDNQNNFTEAKMFDVRLHNKELSATDVVDVMNGKASGFEVGWWKCEEGAGDLSYDSSGNGHHGAITNATLSTFHVTGSPYSFLNNVGYSSSLYYDDVDASNIVSYAQSVDLNPRTDDYTIEAWVYVDYNGTNETICSKGGGGPTVPGYWFRVSTGNYISAYHSNGTSWWGKGKATSVGWHHGAMVVDRDVGLTIYIDGVDSSPTPFSNSADISHKKSKFKS